MTSLPLSVARMGHGYGSLALARTGYIVETILGSGEVVAFVVSVVTSLAACGDVAASVQSRARIRTQQEALAAIATAVTADTTLQTESFALVDVTGAAFSVVRTQREIDDE